MNIDYDNYESEETRRLIENGSMALWGNHIGIEGILHKMVLITLHFWEVVLQGQLFLF